ncbi:MAG: hypothetical protein KJZ86_01090 [Caldilineaceae bacterium]|nr:hypothetical protein [Caldilineaceae bacterium]HRJ43369.1 hypothetical protein [Caldilineaceae bacterium]
MTELTRKEFYQLAIECRERALDLARHDQHRVDREQCRRFNSWLVELKRYTRLQSAVGKMPPARPITRWHVMTGALVLWLLVVFFAGDQMGNNGQRVLSVILAGMLILIYFLPERLYGTTVELLEGKMLRVVETLEAILQSQEMQFTEAAYFQVKENLQIARQELRQQIHLAH